MISSKVNDGLKKNVGSRSSIAMLGVYPPPFGGVAVHLMRLANLLKKERIHFHIYNAVSDTENEDVTSVAANRRRWLVQFLLNGKERGIYVLSDRLSVWVLVAALAKVRRKKFAVRLRNSRLADWMESDPLKAALAGKALRQAEFVVGVSEKLVECAQKVGVPAERTLYMPGFLPPLEDPTEKEQVSPEVWQFMADKEVILSANGKVDWYQNEDLYGLDMLVKLVARLKEDFPKLGLVICFRDHFAEDEDRLVELKEMATQLDVENSVFFNTIKGPFVPVLRASHALVRPTNTDGDANSIREAIYYGVPAVASDSVVRPPGTLLHQNRDLNSLEAQTRIALEQGVSSDEPQLDPETQERVDGYLHFLTKLL